MRVGVVKGFFGFAGGHLETPGVSGMLLFGAPANARVLENVQDACSCVTKATCLADIPALSIRACRHVGSRVVVSRVCRIVRACAAACLCVRCLLPGRVRVGLGSPVCVRVDAGLLVPRRQSPARQITLSDTVPLSPYLYLQLQVRPSSSSQSAARALGWNVFLERRAGASSSARQIVNAHGLDHPSTGLSSIEGMPDI